MKKATYLIPVAAGILFGSVGTFVRVLSGAGLDSGTLLSARFIGGSIVMFLSLLIFKRDMLKIKLKDLWVFLGAGILGMCGLNYCYAESIGRLTLSLAAVLLNLAPIFVMFMAAIIFKERITKRKIVCMAVAVIGCLMVSGLLEVSGGLKWSGMGIVIGLLSAFFYALYSIFSKIGMSRGYHSLTILFYSLLIAAIVLIPIADWSNLGSYIGQVPANKLLFLLVYSIFTSVLPYMLFTLALSCVDAGKTSILSAGGEPSSAMVFGIIFFREIPTVLSFIGMVVTIGALIALCKEPNEPKEQRELEEQEA